MREAANQRTREYQEASQPTRRDLLRLYDILIHGAVTTTFRINDHYLDSRAELEIYPLERIDKLLFSATWEMERSYAFAMVTYDSRGGLCGIDNDLNHRALAVLALADEMFNSSNSATSSELRLPTEPEARSTVQSQVTKHHENEAAPKLASLPQRVWSKLLDHALASFFSVIAAVAAAAVVAYFQLS